MPLFTITPEEVEAFVARQEDGVDESNFARTILLAAYDKAGTKITASSRRKARFTKATSLETLEKFPGQENGSNEITKIVNPLEGRQFTVYPLVDVNTCKKTVEHITLPYATFRRKNFFKDFHFLDVETPVYTPQQFKAENTTVLREHTHYVIDGVDYDEGAPEEWDDFRNDNYGFDTINDALAAINSNLAAIPHGGYTIRREDINSVGTTAGVRVQKVLVAEASVSVDVLTIAAESRKDIIGYATFIPVIEKSEEKKSRIPWDGVTA